jgi:hypothetical protein
MKLIGTVHWVATENLGVDYDDIVRAVQGWNKRKREIMKPAHIRAAYDRLVAEKWLEERKR